MSAASDAERQFAENFNLFGNAQVAPEKFNLYKGLANLARALGAIESRLERLEKRVESAEHYARRAANE